MLIIYLIVIIIYVITTIETNHNILIRNTAKNVIIACTNNKFILSTCKLFAFKSIVSLAFTLLRILSKELIPYIIQYIVRRTFRDRYDKIR